MKETMSEWYAWVDGRINEHKAKREKFYVPKVKRHADIADDIRYKLSCVA